MRFAKLAATIATGFVLFGVGLPANAATPTNRIGDPSGTEFTAACKPGEALVGYAYNSSSMLMAIGALCIPFDGTEIQGPIQKLGSVYGLQGDGAGREPIFCPTGVIKSVTVYLLSNLRVHNIRGTCDRPNEKDLLMGPTKTSEGEAVGKKSVICDTYAVGLVGSWDGGIMSLGLLCQSDDEVAEDEPPADDTGGGDDSGNDDGDDSASGDTFVRFASEPTTVYARPAGQEIKYLEAGDEVTMTSCEDDGRGWCRIVEPTDGFVWGGDFEQ